jgi:hypothetical protein
VTSRVCCGCVLVEAWIAAPAVRKLRALFRHQVARPAPFLYVRSQDAVGAFDGRPTAGLAKAASLVGHLARHVLQAFRSSGSHVEVGRASETNRA